MVAKRISTKPHYNNTKQLKRPSVGSALAGPEKKADEQQQHQRGGAHEIDKTTLFEGGLAAAVPGLGGWREYTHRAKTMEECVTNWEPSYGTWNKQLDRCCDFIHVTTRCRTLFRRAIARGRHRALERQAYHDIQWVDGERSQAEPGNGPPTTPSSSSSEEGRPRKDNDKNDDGPLPFSLNSRLANFGNDAANTIGGIIDRAAAGKKRPSLGGVVGPVGVGGGGVMAPL
ncbi:MAG: hypothetical protein M1816_006113 [Peltula sp. TS41687]|nr:MAG: hypothetical protein M1816_006113 [Peltula sp. TS41687]